ncbi:MAG TPA: serine hydrolase [Trueperaceae bacterium]
MSRLLPWAGAVVVVLAAAFGYAHLRTDTYLGRWFAWRASDVGDMLRFPDLRVAASTEPRALPVLASTAPLTDMSVEASVDGSPRHLPLQELLASTRSAAFVVLAGGAVAGEWYAAGPSPQVRAGPVTSFSVAKSVTALLVAAAFEDGSLSSLDDPVTRYLPALAGTDRGYDQVTLRHLLDMTSGVRFRDHDLPWGDKARVYYEPHLRELVFRLPLTSSPDSGFAYNSYNPVLLGLVLEAATGETVTDYFQRRLWEAVGAAYDATWSVSSSGETLPKMESGLNASPLDFARLGLLLLEDGVVDGQRVLPAQWVEDVTTPDPKRLVEPEAGLHYQQGWWVYAPVGGRQLAVAGRGHLGQYVFVYPELDVVVARFGTSTGGVGSWRAVFDQVACEAALLATRAPACG